MQENNRDFFLGGGGGLIANPSFCTDRASLNKI
jgi:hypothetical protein